MILIDRDSADEESFHCIDLKMYPIEKIISISTVREYNNHMKSLGVSIIIRKDYDDLDEFFLKLEETILNRIHKE